MSQVLASVHGALYLDVSGLGITNYRSSNPPPNLAKWYKRAQTEVRAHLSD